MVVEVLGFEAAGVVFDFEGATHRVPWAQLVAGFASQVGEPDGVRTIVFDLACCRFAFDSEADPEPALLRFSIDPCEEPRGAAQRIVDMLGKAACSSSLHALAREGATTESHVDLQSLDEALFSSLVERPPI